MRPIANYELVTANVLSSTSQVSVSKEMEQLGPSSDRMDNAPVLQLFNNDLLKRGEESSTNDNFVGNSDMSPKTQRVRAELLSLFPPMEDAYKVITQSPKLWCSWCQENPDLCKALSSPFECRDLPIPPADIANILLCLVITAKQITRGYAPGGMKTHLDPDIFSSTCIEAVNRLIIRDDEYAATLPGIECQMLLSKYHLSEGQLRKSWLVTRRAIDLAHLAGMHMSTRNQKASDVDFGRRLKVWCALGACDRSVSLILGLPYGITSSSFIPQAEERIQIAKSSTERWMLKMGIISGHMIDHNQDQSALSLETSLNLDKELIEACENAPNYFQEPEAFFKSQQSNVNGSMPLQFMPKVMRTLLHMPFMLKHPHDPRYRYSYTTAIQSARESLAIYKVIRDSSAHDSNTCKMSDFMAFTMGMLLIVHLYGYSDDKSRYSKKQDASDWELLRELISILRKTSAQKGGSVAAESANVLGSMLANRSKKRRNANSSKSACKITIPYFGSITVVPTKRALQAPTSENETGTARLWPSDHQMSAQNSSQIYTPPMSDRGAASAAAGCADSSDPTPGAEAGLASQANEPTDEYCFTVDQTENMDSNPFGLFADANGYQSWPSFDFDLDLDQGWNLSWFDSTLLSE